MLLLAEFSKRRMPFCGIEKCLEDKKPLWLKIVIYIYTYIYINVLKWKYTPYKKMITPEGLE